MPIDAADLAKLIQTQAAPLELWVRSRCASFEDVVQEAFCRLAIQEPIPQNPVAWLYQVCRNLAQKQRQSDTRRRNREEARARLQIAGPTHDPLELEEMLSHVERLEPDLREVLVARIWGQLTLAEIAQVCSISTATAFRRYEAALESLRRDLKPTKESSP